MTNAEPGFSSRLQLQWSVSQATYSKGRVTLLLERGQGIPFPDPLGRPGNVVEAEPDCFQVEQSAEVTFDEVPWFQIVDEFSASVGIPERGTETKFEGRYFRSCSDSALLDELRKARPEAEAARLKHYQLVTDDEVIEVVSTDAPRDVLRGGALK